jgi:hypothetical protein
MDLNKEGDDASCVVRGAQFTATLASRKTLWRRKHATVTLRPPDRRRRSRVPDLLFDHNRAGQA